MNYLIVALTAIIAIAVGYILRHIIGNRKKLSAERIAAKTLKDAEVEAKRLLQDAQVKAKADILAQREKMENELKKDREELKQIEKRLTKREDNLDRKDEMLETKEQQLRSSEEKLEERSGELESKAAELDEVLKEEREILHKLSGLTPEAAKKEVLRKTEEDCSHEIEVLLSRANARAKEMADENAKKYVANAIGRLAVDYTTEHVVSTVELPSDEMKGRIIGREGRNIRAFESATGVDVIVDDTPGVVVLSGFEAVRREIAVRAMTKLVNDGRIHPSRIEEVVEKTREEMEKVIEDTGKEVALELDVRNLKPREIMLLGRLKFRTSYGQNVLDHSRDVGFLSGMLAAELGLDESLARRCGLLHDIGKAVDHEEEGTHPELGGEVARRCNEPEEVINSVIHHHTPGAGEDLYATIVQAADAISAARPGARRETLEKYVKRLERLESIANNYPEVERAFAIQAGRELRVIARAEKVNDEEASRICRLIAKQIEDELTYPGEVKVTLVRELRITEYAR